MKFSTLGRIAACLSFALFGACFLSGSYAAPKLRRLPAIIC